MGWLPFGIGAAVGSAAYWLGYRMGFDRAWKKAGGEICNMGYGEVLVAPTCRRCGHRLDVIKGGGA